MPKGDRAARHLFARYKAGGPISWKWEQLGDVLFDLAPLFPFLVKYFSFKILPTGPDLVKRAEFCLQTE